MHNSYIRSIIIAFMIAISLNTKAQEKLNILGLTPEETYEYLKVFALENGYFIQNMDSKGQWIQVKWNYKPKKIFKNTRKYRINFLVSGNKNQGSTLTLQMNEEILRSDDSGGSYYEDAGIIQEGEEHELLMQRIEGFFQNIKV